MSSTSDKEDAIPESVITEVPKTPKIVRPPINTYSRTLSMDPSVHSLPRWSGNPSLQEAEEKPQYEQSLRSPSVLIKWLQLMVTLVCMSLYSDGSHLLKHNAATVHFHFIVFSSYTIITGVMLLSYILGMKMREVLMRLFNILGAIMFLASCLISLQNVVAFWPKWDADIDENDPTNDVASIPRRRISIVCLIVFSFSNACLYMADVCYSLWRTLALL